MIEVEKYDDFSKEMQRAIKTKISVCINRKIGVWAEKMSEKELEENSCFEITKEVMKFINERAYYKGYKIIDSKRVFKDIMSLANKRKTKQYEVCKSR